MAGGEAVGTRVAAGVAVAVGGRVKMPGVPKSKLWGASVGVGASVGDRTAVAGRDAAGGRGKETMPTVSKLTETAPVASHFDIGFHPGWRAHISHSPTGKNTISARMTSQVLPYQTGGVLADVFPTIGSKWTRFGLARRCPTPGSGGASRLCAKRYQVIRFVVAGSLVLRPRVIA